MIKNINIYTNCNEKSLRIKDLLIKKLEENNIQINTNEKPCLNIAIGGDGSFLKAVRSSRYSQAPFVGINTGHLGFYQEISPDHLDKFIDDIYAKNYFISKINLLSCYIDGSEEGHYAVNDFVVKEKYDDVVHLDVYLEDFHLESFSGDGLIVSTPTGSTAYNYSVGGAILYQELRGYQLAPIAPISTRVYRSLANPIVMPEHAVLSIQPKTDSKLIIDGQDLNISANKKYNFYFGQKFINKLVFDQNWYWESIRDKFL